MRKRFFVAVLLCAGCCVNAQDGKLANTLLWRISGKGLTEPSYLYGTMHLTDKRVFQLGDSVYKALEKTAGFAAELDMNRVGVQMMNQFMKQQQEKNAVESPKIKEVVSEQVWNNYKEQLEKKFGKKADKITVADLEEIESRLDVDLFRKGDMPTFLDAWLSGQARKQGKWVGGIEDIEDQLEHIDDIEGKIQTALFDDNYYRGSLDWFIKVYTDQKLDTIDAFMYREANGQKDIIMIKRNIKMARRMDSLSAIRSTLFAVGAAHLPGDSGVIALLRSRGFTVTPVISSKKINPDKYNAKTVEVPWVPVKIDDASYSLQMPGEADPIDLLTSMGVDMKMFFDISTMKLFMTMAVDMPAERRKIELDTLYSTLRSRFGSSSLLMKEKKITANDISGREYQVSSLDGDMKMQIFIPDTKERIVMNMVFAFNEKALGDKETDRFFKSFAYNHNAPKPVIAEKTWRLLEYPHLSFSIEMPDKPKEKKDVVSQPGQIMYEWQSIDLRNQFFYGMNVSSMKENMYDPGDDSAYFLGIKEQLRGNFEDATVIDSSFLIIDGYPAFTFGIKGKTEGQSYETKIKAVTRGGLTYYMYAIYSPGETSRKNADRFLGSFKLIPFKYPQWKTTPSPDGSFNTTAAFAFREVEKEEGDLYSTQRFIIYDSLAYLTSFVDRTKIPSWFWYSSDTAFLRHRSLQYSSYEDSVAEYTVSGTDKMRTASFLVLKKGDNVFKRVKFILNKDELYEIQGNYSPQDIKDKYERFFNDFKIVNEKGAWSQTTPRIEELEKAMQSADEDKIGEIDYWWEGLDFTAEHIPALHKMMLKIYPDFDTTYYGNLNSKLFDKIEFLDSNYTSVEYIRKNFASIKPEDEYIKAFIFPHLVRIKTAASYAVLKECLLNHPLGIKTAPYFGYALYDSIKLTMSLFPEIMKIGASEPLWEQISATTCYLMDSAHLSKTLIKEYGKYFVESAKRELKKDKQEIEDANYMYSDLIKLLGVVGTPEAVALLKQFTKYDAREIKFRTYIALLEAHQSADSKTAYTLAINDEYRHHLYDELKRINRLKLFPGSYLSQKELGRSKVYEAAVEDDEEPGLISDEGERVILYKGKQQKFYLYKVYDYLAVAGPYPMNSKDMSSSHDATGIYWSEEFDAKNIDKLFDDYMKELGEVETEKKEEVKPPPPPPLNPPGVEIKKN